MSDAGKESAFRKDIEGLRGIAVLLVVLFHCGVWGAGGGFIGVDVFFVLSGYLITGLLVAEIEKRGRLDLIQFYARRIRRLLPASALTLLVTLAVGAVVLAPQELTFAGRAARATSVYMSNVFFGINAADYFSADVDTNPVLHTWSLAVEEQFYFFWPLLIMMGLQGLKSKRALVWVLSMVTALSLAASIWFTAHGGTFAFYQLPARAWEFGVGGLAILLPRQQGRVPEWFWLALGWSGVATVLAAGAWMPGGPGFPGWIALIPAAGTIAALLCGAELPRRGVAVLLDSVPMQAMGKLSYSWYLWHWPFLVLGAALFPDITVAGRLAAAALAFVLATITHRLVENPIRFNPYLMARPVRSLYLGGVLTVGSLVVSWGAMEFAGRMGRDPKQQTILAAVGDISRLPRKECVVLGESPDVKVCEFGTRSSEIHVVLFGDSHAIQWFNPLQRMAEERGWHLTTLVKSGCPATDIAAPGTSKRFTSACASWRAEALRKIQGWNPSVVVVANATNYLGLVGRERPNAVSLDDWRAGTRRTLSALANAGIRVASMRDNPQAAGDVPTCLARAARHSWYPGGSCELNRAMTLKPVIFETEKAGAQGLPNVRFIDLTDELCGVSGCPAVRDGIVTYRDDNHLTGGFADRLRPALESRLLATLDAPLEGPQYSLAR